MKEIDMKVLCRHIINGGSVLDFCEAEGVAYDELWEWIQAEPGRGKMYDKAIVGQNEWAIVRVLKELKCVALADIRELYGEDGKLLHPKDWPEHVARAVSTVDVFEEYEGSGKSREFVGCTKRVRVMDKLKALEMVGKYLKMFVDRVDMNVTTLEDLVDSSYDMRREGRLPGVEEIPPTGLPGGMN